LRKFQALGKAERDWGEIVRKVVCDITEIVENEKNLRFQDGLLLREDRVVISQALRSRLVRTEHIGHSGMVGMKRTIRKSAWWPVMDNDIENLVKNCKG
jgi:hypothetical protein